MGLSPLFAIDVVSGLVLGAELRPGNVYTSDGVNGFLRPIIDRYQDQATCLIRGDSGFAFDKTDSISFIANRARLFLSAIAYNLFQLFKQLGLSEKEQTRTAATIRNQLFRMGGKITRHARMIQLRLTSANIYDTLFWETLIHIQHMRFQL